MTSVITAICLVVVVLESLAVPSISQPDGAYIVVLKPGISSPQHAAARLVSQVTAARGGESTSAASDTDSTALELTTLDGFSLFTSTSGSTAEESSVAALPAADQGVQAIVVKGASSAVLAAIQTADIVAYVVPDLKIRAATAGCTDAASLGHGLVSAAAPTSVWPGNNRCVNSDTQLVWIGERCGDSFNYIQYKAIYAMDRTTNSIKQYAGKDCVLLPREVNANFNRLRFGSCGVAPALAPDLPSTLCPSSTDKCLAFNTSDPSTSPASVLTLSFNLRTPVRCGSKRTTRLTYTGIPCGPNQQYVAWVSATGPGGCKISLSSGFKPLHDVLGSCGVPPGEAVQIVSMRICDTGSNPPPGNPGSDPPPPPPAPSPSPTPNPGGNSSPPNATYTLKKVPVAAGQTVPKGIYMIEAATAAGIADPSLVPAADQVLVGVLDSGVDSSHPDLSYAGGKSFLDGSQPGQDSYGHGTHVAGVIGAVNNAYGVVGVSPGTGIYSLRVLDDTGEGKLSTTLAAVKWVTTDGIKLGIKVINLSLVTYLDPANSNYAALKAAVCQYYKEASDAGVVITAAAGNDGSSIEGYFPAVCPHVIAVTALDSTGKSAATSYSNWIATTDTAGMAHAVAAPGTAVLSTVPTAVDSSGYYMLTGTSGAAPHVAGVAANCLMSGACKSTNTGAQSMAVIMDDAEDRAGMGAPVVKYNPQDTVAAGKWFGYLLYAKY